MEQKIQNYLLKLGFVPNKLGYRMLYDILLWGASGENLLPLKYVAYPRLSLKYTATPWKKTFRTPYP